jgi:HD domain
MTLEPWAKAQAEGLIAPLGDRWLHVQAVARKARRVAVLLPAQDADLLVAAAFLHDVGYAPSLNRLGFHPIDGARFLRAHGQERLGRIPRRSPPGPGTPRSASPSTATAPSILTPIRRSGIAWTRCMRSPK